ncbi:MAG: hypothetical protein HUK25_07830, partial [Treponema sp.]|nr:hypothetical protein [Treponema sp.]
MNRKTLNFINLFAGFLGLVVFCVTTFSCEIGLGASVDTSRPTVEITYPPKNSIIRDTFILAGNATDDRELSSVKVTVTSATTGKSFTKELPVTGTKVPQGTATSDSAQWQFELNKKNDDGTWEMLDGKYTIEVISIDKENKESQAASLTVEVDNTAPFFIASKPGSKRVNNPSRYGSNLSVTGTIEEAHSIVRMDMKVFELDASGNRIPGDEGVLFSEQEIQISNSHGVKFADNNKADGETLKENYKKLYKNAADSKNYSCELEFFDNAKQYINPGEEKNETAGNSTKDFYITDDLTSLTSVSQGLGLSTEEIRDIFNGTKTIDSGAAVKKILEDNTRNEVFFSLNPKNNPYFNIGSSSFEDGLPEDKIISTANSGISITVQYTAGRDDINVVPSSLRLFMVGPFDSYTTALGNAIFDSSKYIKAKSGYPKEEVKNGASYTKYEYEVDCSGITEFGADKVVPLSIKQTGNEDFELDASATNLNYNYILPTLTPGKFYFLVAVGEDQEKNSILCADGYFYGFKAQGSGTPPQLTINSYNESAGKYLNLVNNSTVNSKSYEFTGSATGEIEIFKVLCTVNVKCGNEVKLNTTYDCNIAGQLTSTTWSFEYPGSLQNTVAFEDDKEYTVGFTFKAEDKDGRSSSDVYREITVDLKKPEISINAVQPNVEYNGKTCVNKKITVSFNASDAIKYSKTKCQFYAGTRTDANKLGTEQENNNVNGNFTVDTSSVDKKDLIIVLTAIDEAGNEKELVNTDYYIDQDSDNPVVDVSNSADSSIGFNGINKDKNLFTINGSHAGSISTTVTDDDSVSEIYAYYYKAGNDDDPDNTLGTRTEFYKETGKNGT